MKIAIVGTGISGLGAAYLLNRKHDTTVYEPNGYAGGHSRTITVQENGKDIAVDTGFIVFNKKNYPLMTRLFDELQVPLTESDMSFGASIHNGWLEYGSKGLFAQKANLARPKFWGMVRDILKFNRTAMCFIDGREDITLRQCLKELGLGQWFQQYYLQAMGAAIWSCSAQTILDFPAKSFLQFFDNHGLLTVNGHPQWYTVKGGSKEYVTRLTASFQDKIRLNCGAMRIERTDTGVEVTDATGTSARYDHVVLACHADEALQLLANPSHDERKILSAFKYQDNQVVVHCDESFMPQRKACWASWVYLSEDSIDRKPVVSLTYWMNQLQRLSSDRPLLVTLNPGRAPRAEDVYDRHCFSHPVFTLETLQAQRLMPTIQNRDRISYCGAYQRYGFHEDGFMSAVAVARNLGVDFG